MGKTVHKLLFFCVINIMFIMFDKIAILIYNNSIKSK